MTDEAIEAAYHDNVAGLVERATAAIELGQRMGVVGSHETSIYRIAIDLREALTALSIRLAEATVEIEKRRLTMARDQVASAMAYRDAVVAACDENLSEYKHRAREAEARAAALERELTETKATLAEAERERDEFRSSLATTIGKLKVAQDRAALAKKGAENG